MVGIEHLDKMLILIKSLEIKSFKKIKTYRNSLNLLLLLKLFSNLCYIYLVWTEDTFFQSAFYLIIVFNVQVQARMEDLDPDPQPSMI